MLDHSRPVYFQGTPHALTQYLVCRSVPALVGKAGFYRYLAWRQAGLLANTEPVASAQLWRHPGFDAGAVCQSSQ